MLKSHEFHFGLQQLILCIHVCFEECNMLFKGNLHSYDKLMLNCLKWLLDSKSYLKTWKYFFSVQKVGYHETVYFHILISRAPPFWISRRQLVVAIVMKSMKQKILCVKQWLQPFYVIKSKMAAPGKLKNGNRQFHDTQLFVHWKNIFK